MNEPAARRTEIHLRNVRVHNLRGIDLDIPLGQLIVLTGVSGSGKSSLAFDTLYAEGQRRYLESFSLSARQFLDRVERPDADRVDHVPPAIALRQRGASRPYGRRETFGTVTEVLDYLRLLFVRLGRVRCRACGIDLNPVSIGQVIEAAQAYPAGTRAQIAFIPPPPTSEPAAPPKKSRSKKAAAPDPAASIWKTLNDAGFRRLIRGSSTEELNLLSPPGPEETPFVVVDRVSVGTTTRERWSESLETAFRYGDGVCLLLVQTDAPPVGPGVSPREIDGKTWQVREFRRDWRCPGCRHRYRPPTPGLLNFQSNEGACPTCQGEGHLRRLPPERLIDQPARTLASGAVSYWRTLRKSDLLKAWIDKGPALQLPVELPLSRWTAEQLGVLLKGDKRRKLTGLLEESQRLEEESRAGESVSEALPWLVERCPECEGTRLNREARAVHVQGLHFDTASRHDITTLSQTLTKAGSELSARDVEVSQHLFQSLRRRIDPLLGLRVGHLPLDREASQIATGELRRGELARTLASNLVNTLYVLDEPAAGLHPHDLPPVIDALRTLRDRPNSVVVVEHTAGVIAAADQVIDIGPGPGVDGGTIVFQGSYSELLADEASPTGAALRTPPKPRSSQPRESEHRWSLRGLVRKNLKGVDLDIPLGQLGIVHGVSGGGKTALLEAVEAAARTDAGAAVVPSVVMIDASPVSRSRRSYPVGYLAVFGEIRKLFAETATAKSRNFTPQTFSFQSPRGGRCDHCRGDGRLHIDLKFLPDLEVTCPVCRGRRYRPDVLDVLYRGRTIADVLAMSADEALAFFRNQPRVQQRLSLLSRVGLGYLGLGQPLSTLSGGEAQRLKLASYLSANVTERSLFLCDEPTIGLHPADVLTLRSCFTQLVDVGHTVLLADNHPLLAVEADWRVELGPGAGPEGGTVVSLETSAR